MKFTVILLALLDPAMKGIANMFSMMIFINKLSIYSKFGSQRQMKESLL
jgi:hypothetical protein